MNNPKTPATKQNARMAIANAAPAKSSASIIRYNSSNPEIALFTAKFNDAHP